jgi:hypothetical protein
LLVEIALLQNREKITIENCCALEYGKLYLKFLCFRTLNGENYSCDVDRLMVIGWTMNERWGEN